MAELKINKEWIAFLVSLTVLIGFVMQSYQSLTEDLATKADIQEIKTAVNTIRIDSSISLIKLYLKDLDAFPTLTAAQQREKAILEKKLEEFEMQRVSAANE